MSAAAKAEIVITAVDQVSAKLNAISARIDGVTAPVRRLGSAFAGVYGASGVKGVVGAFGSLADTTAGAARNAVLMAGSLGAAVGAVIGFAKHAADAADKIGDLSARYQVHAHSIQVYGGLVEEAGGSTEEAAAAMGKLRKAMNEAIHGGTEQAAAFAGVGISVEKLKKMSPEEVMQQMADAFKSSNKEGEKNAVLLQLMGKNGTVFMDVMNKGGAAYQQRLEEMRADGSLLSEEQLKQADEFDKSWSRMQRTLEGVKNALGLRLAKAIEPMVQGIQKWVVANRALIDQKFEEFLAKLPALLEAAGQLLQGLWSVAQGVASAFKAVASVIGPTGAALAGVTVVMSPFLLAAGQLAFAIGKVVWVLGNFTGIIPKLMALLSNGLWATMMANPIGLIIAAVAALAYVIYKNWDNITAYVGAAWERIKAVFEVGFFDGMFQMWLEGWQAFGNAIVGIIKTLTPDFLMPDSLKNFQFTFATERAQKVTSEAAQAQQQNITNTVRLEIDAEGRPRVKDMKAGSDKTTIDVYSGLSMVGM